MCGSGCAYASICDDEDSSAPQLSECGSDARMPDRIVLKAHGRENRDGGDGDVLAHVVSKQPAQRLMQTSHHTRWDPARR